MKHAAVDELLDWDASLRSAIQSGQVEAVPELMARFVPQTDMDKSPVPEELARNLSDILSRNIKLAVQIRDQVRQELAEVARQRKCMGHVAPVSRSGRNFVA